MLRTVLHGALARPALGTALARPGVLMRAIDLRGTACATFFSVVPALRASTGNTVTFLPACHWITVGNARVFWNLSSNFAPKPVG